MMSFAVSLRISMSPSCPQGVRTRRTVYVRGVRSGSEGPGDGSGRVRGVGAEVAGLDPGFQVGPQRGVALSDPGEGVLDAFRDGQAGTLGGRAELPVPAPEPDGGRELAREELDLLTGPLGAAEIVELLGLLQFLAQLRQAAPVGLLRPGVEDGAPVPEARERHLVPDQLDDRPFPAR